MPNIGQMVRERRKALGMSVRELRDALRLRGVDVSEKTIYSWEGGHRQPDADTFIILCEVLGVRSFSGMKKAPSSNMSKEALQVAQIYDTLDQYGRDAVMEVAKIEQARCEDEERFLRDANPQWEDEEEIVIDEFTFRPAAGPLLGVAGQERVPYVLQPGDPRGAVYTTIIDGDSMAPDFPDGSRIFVNLDQLADGDIGVFCVDGAMVVKQYHYDAVLGYTYLFSLNRKRNDMDIVVTPGSGISLVCQGRVMTRRHYPLPM